MSATLPAIGTGTIATGTGVVGTTPTASGCTGSNSTAITTACKCAATATNNECAVGKFCYDGVCNDNAKSAGVDHVVCCRSQ